MTINVAEINACIERENAAIRLGFSLPSTLDAWAGCAVEVDDAVHQIKMALHYGDQPTHYQLLRYHRYVQMVSEYAERMASVGLNYGYI